MARSGPSHCDEQRHRLLPQQGACISSRLGQVPAETACVSPLRKLQQVACHLRPEEFREFSPFGPLAKGMAPFLGCTTPVPFPPDPKESLYPVVAFHCPPTFVVTTHRRGG